MLSLLAAVVPILGSLYVGLSFLLEQARLSHERRVRERILPLVAERDARASRRLAGVRPGSREWDEIRAEPRRFESMLLAYNGVEGARKTMGEFDIELNMSAPLLHATERQRQWVLLLSAALGLVLLGIDAGLPTT